ncbi:MAG: dienelactone hydrolase family protein [Planctomycetota bacterium]
MRREKRPLLTFDRMPGFLCDWHIAGFLDSGLQPNPGPNLFDQKHATLWKEEHLGRFGGAALVRDVPKLRVEGLPIQWSLLPTDYEPELSLNRGRELFPAWAEKLNGHDSDRWSKLYFALALVDSPNAGPALLHFSGWDGCRLWINGELKFEEHSYHHVILDMEKLQFKLRRGLNSFLFQLDRDGVAARIEIPGRPALVKKLRSVAIGDPPARREVSTFSQLRNYALSLNVEQPFKGRNAGQLKSWQKSFRDLYHRSLGPLPHPLPKTYGKATLISSQPQAGYTLRRYHIQGEAGGTVPCYVLIPDKGKFNGRTIVHAHGHESHFSQVSGLKPQSGPKIFIKEDYSNYSQRMAQKGFLTAVCCQRNFDVRRDYFGGDDPCNQSHLRALAMSLTLPRLHMADIHLLYDLVTKLPGVDKKRVGLAGLSGGGTMTYLLGAYDERFKACASFCGTCRYVDYALGRGCGMQVVPNLFPAGDVGEICSLIAPRPLMLGQGRFDSTFNSIRVKSVYEDALRAYQAAGVPDRIEFNVYDLAHQYPPDIAEQFFLKWL